MHLCKFSKANVDVEIGDLKNQQFPQQSKSSSKKVCQMFKYSFLNYLVKP